VQTLQSERATWQSRAEDAETQVATQRAQHEADIATAQAEADRLCAQLEKVEASQGALFLAAGEQPAAHTVQAGAADLAADSKRLGEQLQTLQKHMLVLEDGFTEDALRRDEQITYLQQQLNESRTGAVVAGEAAVARQEQLEVQCATQQETLAQQAAALAAARAEAAALQAEHARALVAQANLESVLHGFEAERELRAREEAVVAARVQEGVHAAADAAAARVQVLEAHVAELEAAAARMAAALGETQGLRGRVAALESEGQALQARLAEAQAMVATAATAGPSDGSSGELVGKALVRNMLVAYFTSDKREDVLRVLAGLLDMDETERYRVGLHVRRGFLASLISGPEPPPPPPTTAAAIHRQTLTEQFVRFLLKEAVPDSGSAAASSTATAAAAAAAAFPAVVTRPAPVVGGAATTQATTVANENPGAPSSVVPRPPLSSILSGGAA
jgi:hypothetical protein